MFDPVDKQPELEENLQLRQIYTSRLSERINQMEEVWQGWQEGDCQDAYSRLEQLCFLAHGLNNSDSIPGYSGLAIKARMLELFLKAVLETGSTGSSPISLAQISRIGLLLREIKQATSQSDFTHSAFGSKTSSGLTTPISSAQHLKLVHDQRLVFVLEEEPELAQNLIRHLERSGYAARHFKDMLELEQAAIQDEPIALVLSLVCLEQQPQSQKILNCLRSESLTPLTIIFTSDPEQADQNSRLNAVRAGGNAFLVKPFELEELSDKLDELTLKRLPRPYRIVLVDDDVDLLNMYSLILRNAGMEVQVISDPLKALPAIIEFQPDLIVVDVYMDGCNGMELAAVIRQHKGYSNIPIIFLSVESSISKQLNAINIGGDDFLTKPIQPEHLVCALRIRAERGRILKAFNEELELRVVDRTTNLTKVNDQLGSEVMRQRRLEEDLKDSNRRLTSILESITDGFFALDQRWCFTYLNSQAERILQRRQDSLLGKSLWEEMPETANLVFFEESHPIIIGERKAYSGERYYAPLKAWFEVRAYPYEGGLAVYLHDITAHKRADEEMWKVLEKEHELSDLKSRFVSTTSHEFRTPLSTILSSSELLQRYDQRWTAEKKQELFQRIQEAVKRMTSLLNDVLLISKSDAGKLEFKPSQLNLTDFCRGIIKDLQLGIGANHELQFNFPPQPVEGWFDENLLQHILGNLLSNAIKYSSENTVIYLNLSCEGDTVKFEVRDEGIGIPLDDQTRLFELFHRAKNVGTIPGTGLGLAIVKRSVDLHQGRIQVDSQAGRGTTFTVVLPWNTSQQQIPLTQYQPKS